MHTLLSRVITSNLAARGFDFRWRRKTVSLTVSLTVCLTVSYAHSTPRLVNSSSALFRARTTSTQIEGRDSPGGVHT